MDKGAQIWLRDRARTFFPPLRLATLSHAFFPPLPFFNIIDVDIDVMSVIHLYSVLHFVLDWQLSFDLYWRHDECSILIFIGPAMSIYWLLLRSPALAMRLVYPIGI